MIKDVFKLLLTLISLALIVTNYFIFDQMKLQSFLINDFNTDQKRINIEDIKGYNYLFPNITATGIPMTTLIARYYLRDKKDSLAIKLLNKSKEASPYLGIYDFELAKYYNSKREFDKAELFANQALEKLPNNVNHLALYYSILVSSNKIDLLKKDFNKRKSGFKEKNYHDNMWKIFFLSILKANKTLTEEERNLFETQRKYFKNSEALSSLMPFIYVGEENINEAVQNAKLAETFFDSGSYEKAAQHYLSAFKSNQREVEYIENAALCYFKLDQYSKSEQLFKTILDYDSERLKSNFYLSLLLFDSGRNKEGCKYIQKCTEKRYPMSIEISRKYCLN